MQQFKRTNVVDIHDRTVKSGGELYNGVVERKVGIRREVEP